MKAVWNGETKADSDDTVIIEGNYYFPADSIRKEYIKSSSTTTVCPWKGGASYYSLEVGSKENKDAVRFYQELLFYLPKPLIQPPVLR